MNIKDLIEAVKFQVSVRPQDDFMREVAEGLEKLYSDMLSDYDAALRKNNATTEKNSATEMTDSEIIKALECCMDEMGCTKGCPCFNPKAKGSHCTVAKKLELEKLTLDLINRQKAEIEQYKADKEEYIKDYAELENAVKFFEADRNFEKQRAYFQLKENEFLEIQIKKAKSEAVKEFAESVTYCKDCVKRELMTSNNQYFCNEFGGYVSEKDCCSRGVPYKRKGG